MSRYNCIHPEEKIRIVKNTRQGSRLYCGRCNANVNDYEVFRTDVDRFE